MTEERSIDTIAIGTRHRRDMGNIEELVASIKEVGLLHPIVVTPDGRLVAGQRRLEACRGLGWQAVPVRVVDIAEIVRGELHENVVRKDFLPSEMAAIAKALSPAEREAAKERRAANLPNQTGKFPVCDEGRSRDKVAAYVGVSGRTVEKTIAVVDAAEREPEKYAPLVEQMDRTGKVNGAYKLMGKMMQAEAIRHEPPPLPTGPFRVIVADPPWPYHNRAEDSTHRAANPYPAMTTDDIKALPVPGMAADDCVLWLWTTNAHMRQAFDVLDAWGFEHKTILTWVKDKMGLGDWLRGQTEHCLMAVRGKPIVLLTNQTTVIYGPLREHSRKPDEFYRLVDQLCPGAKLEMFAREHRDGWAIWGSEVARFGD